MNMKDLPPNSSGDSVGCWKVVVDDQRVVVLLARRKRNFDEVRVCLRILRHKLLDFLHGTISFGSWGD